LQYQWYRGDISSPITTDGTASTLTVTQPGRYFVTVSAPCNDQLRSFVQSATATVTGCTPPALTTGPLSRDVLRGAPAILHVGATGDALTYQWYTGIKNDTTHPIPEATTAFLTVVPDANADYWVRVTDHGVCASSSETLH